MRQVHSSVPQQPQDRQDLLYSYSQVSDFSRLPEVRKYCGFSMTGILVIPMMTASGPISDEEGVLLPLDT